MTKTIIKRDREKEKNNDLMNASIFLFICSFRKINKYLKKCFVLLAYFRHRICNNKLKYENET